MANSIDGVWGLRNNIGADSRPHAKTRGGVDGGERESNLGGAQEALLLTDTARSLQAVERRLNTATEIDEAKVARIAAMVADGSYKIDANAVATQFLAMERALAG